LNLEEFSEDDLHLALKRTRKEVKTKLGYSVVFERKPLVGHAMEGLVSSLGGDNVACARAKAVDEEISRLRQKHFELLAVQTCPGLGKRQRALPQTNKKKNALTEAEAKRFKEAMVKLDMSKQTFWASLSAKVGRNIETCQAYFRRKDGSSSKKRIVNPKPKATQSSKQRRALPKTDCPLRLKYVRNQLKNDFVEASKSSLGDCFDPDKNGSQPMVLNLDEITLGSLENLEAPMPSPPHSPLFSSDSLEHMDNSLSERFSDIEESVTPHNLETYVHTARKNKRKRPLSQAHSRRAFLPCARRRLATNCELRDLLRKKDRQVEKDKYGDDDIWDAFGDGSDESST